jgi:hypothetical protein
MPDLVWTYLPKVVRDPLPQPTIPGTVVDHPRCLTVNLNGCLTVQVSNKRQQSDVPRAFDRRC